MRDPGGAEMALLVARDISKSFGGIVALNRLSVSIEEGEAVGLVGPNGAGKTTLFNCLLGLVRPDTGSVSFDGIAIDHLPTFRRTRLGIGRTFQRLELFAGMTPREHVLVTERVRGGRGRLWKDLLGVGRPSAQERRETDEILALVGLEREADVPVEALSLGHGRLVELARALVGEPRLLMLDEPSSGLDRAERVELVAIFDRVRAERGAAVLLVEHDLEMVAAATQRLLVLDFGRLIADGPIDRVIADPGVRRAYLGHLPAAPGAVATRAPAGRVRGRLHGDRPGRFSSCTTWTSPTARTGRCSACRSRSPSARRSRSSGRTGPASRRSPASSRGSSPRAPGRIVFDGADVTRWPAWRIARLGVAHAPEGRSVFASLTVEENLCARVPARRRPPGPRRRAGPCLRDVPAAR